MAHDDPGDGAPSTWEHASWVKYGWCPMLRDTASMDWCLLPAGHEGDHKALRLHPGAAVQWLRWSDAQSVKTD